MFLPRSTFVQAVWSNGHTVLTLPETPVDNTPVRVVMNGQVLNADGYSVTAQSIRFEPGLDLSEHYFEVDYYVSGSIFQPPATQAPTALDALPLLLDLSTLQAASRGESGNGFADLQLAMLGWSEFDLVFDTDLHTDSSLQTAIIISLFTDARVDDQRGWWGDSYRSENEAPIADSKLWTLMGKPPTADNVKKGQRYAKQALQWLIDDQHLDRIDISAEHQYQGMDMLALHISAITPRNTRLEFLLRF